MRVVAGTARGRRLVAPPGVDTRPTSDRVREAIFGALGSLGVVEGGTVLDLFAGSGALGIEALSRGAARATFVERDRQAQATIKDNLAATGLSDSARVVAGDAVRFAARQRSSFTLALIDPPYAFSDWPRLLADLPAEVVVIESDRSIDPGQNWLVMREKRYGTTVVAIARRLSEKELAS